MIALDEAWSAIDKTHSRFFKIGPFTIQISSPDNSLLRQLTRAFAHLKIEGGAPDLQIRLCSGQLPSLNWSQIQTNGYRGYAEPPLYWHHFELIGALSVTDTKRNIAYYAVRDLKTLPWWVGASPLQVILHVWLRDKGMQLTHGACIVEGKSGLLLAGKGGSGKSTTVLACLEAGLATLGEDYVILAPNQTYSVYQTAKWQPQTRTLFPRYEAHIANPDTATKEKALVHYLSLFPSQLIPSCALKGVVSLSVGSATELQPSDLRTSLQSLLLTTAMQLPHPDPRTAQLLQARLQPLPHHRLILGPDMKKNVAALRSLLT